MQPTLPSTPAFNLRSGVSKRAMDWVASIREQPYFLLSASNPSQLAPVTVWNSSHTRRHLTRSDGGNRSWSRRADSTRLTIVPPMSAAGAAPMLPWAVDTRSTNPSVRTSESMIVDSLCPMMTEALASAA